LFFWIWLILFVDIQRCERCVLHIVILVAKSSNLNQKLNPLRPISLFLPSSELKFKSFLLLFLIHSFILSFFHSFSLSLSLSLSFVLIAITLSFL
jgi:hypothetical protein